MLRYDSSTSPASSDNETVAAARRNTSYKVLRTVLKLILWCVLAIILIVGLSTISVGDKIIAIVSSGAGFATPNPVFTKKEIGPSFEKEISLFELSDNFTANEFISAFSTKRAELQSNENRYLAAANLARSQHNQTDMNESVNLVNSTRSERSTLTNAKKSLESRINEILEERKDSLRHLESGFRVFYFLTVILVMVVATLLVYALYQAAIVVIDIADCQVEIFTRTKERLTRAG